MTSIPVIAGAECRRLFGNLLGWQVIAGSQLLNCMVLLGVLSNLSNSPELLDGQVGVTEIAVSAVYGMAALLMLLLVPILTMRSISEERRSGSIQLLLAAPVRATEIVIGKLLGVTAPLAAICLLCAVTVLSLLPGTALDPGRLACATTGLLLLAMSFASVGLFLSSMTRTPAAAAFGSFALILLLWLLAVVAGLGITVHVTGLAIPVSDIAGWLSPITHYETLVVGIADVGDLLYFLHFTALFIGLAVFRFESVRG